MVFELKLRGEDVDVHQLLMESECHDLEDVKEFIEDAADGSETKSRAIQRVFDKQNDEDDDNPFDDITLADLNLELETIEEMDCEL